MSRSVTDLEALLVQTERERDAAVARETALARIAQRINEHPLDLEGTLTELCEVARELTDGDSARVYILDGENLLPGPGATGRAPTEFEVSGVRDPIPLSSNWLIARAVRERIAIAHDDLVQYVATEVVADSPQLQHIKDRLVRQGLRCVINAPLGRVTPLGCLAVYRIDVRPFSAAELTTLEAFAAQAAVAIETARAQQALAAQNEALAACIDRETATADILRIISQTPGEIGEVMAAIGRAASRLCDADSAFIAAFGERGDVTVWDPLRGHRTVLSDRVELATEVEIFAGPVESLADRYPVPARVARHEGLTEVAELHVPMLSTAGRIGVINLRRHHARPFSNEHILLLQHFAAQAVIASENARVFNQLQARNVEISAALEREQATSEVLDVINRSQADLQPVLDTIAMLAGRLMSSQVNVMRATATHIESVVWVNDGIRQPLRSLAQPLVLPSYGSAPATLEEPRGSATAIAIRDGRTIHLHGGIDAIAEQWPGTAAGWRGPNWHSGLIVPLVLKDVHWGAIHVARQSSDPYTPEQIALLETFAAQAAIAIENSRLLAELHQRNRDVSAALEQQKALSDVLNVIANSATDAKPVLEAILETGSRLCMADGASAVIVKGDELHAQATTGQLAALTRDDRATWPIDRHSASGQAILDRRVVQIEAYHEREYRQYRSVASLVEDYGIRAAIAVPLLRGEDALGALAFARMNDEPFTPQQVALIETFASQAVIAIENARMFNELQARNVEISEALRREEAGSEILRQISRAPEQLDDTLQAIAEAASRLTGMSANLSLLEDSFRVVRGHARVDSVPPFKGGERLPLTAALRRVVQTRQPLSWSRTDTTAVEEYWFERGLTAVAVIPIVQSEVVLGFLGLASVTVEAIAPSAIALLQSFADQAAIAIENARLIRELRESNRAISENLDIQRVMGDVLSIVARTPSDLDATLPAIAKATTQLCDAHGASVHWIVGDQLHMFDGEVMAMTPVTAEWRKTSMVAPVALERRPIESLGRIVDLEANYPFSGANLRRQGFTDSYSALSLPMQGHEGALGAITVWRDRAVPFTERQHSVLAALATQAVVAIENSKLFNQLKAKTEELEIASRHKSEFLANMSHELRTPLNAIIGYAELLQEECEDLGSTDFLPDLGKIHSAGKHLLILISGILDLSKVEAGRMTMFLEDFDVATLIKDADAIVRPLVEKNRNTFVIDCPDDIGVMHADLVKVRQVLFNLLSNSAKFTEGGMITLSVGKQEGEGTIRFAIRDTGIGMTEEQLGRLFEAFSQANAETSRKYGGTGLGLALSREFCRMMGGDITVASVAGEGSTFTVILPIRCVDVEPVQ